MSRSLPLLATLLAGAVAAPGAGAVAQEQRAGLEARVWLDRGDEPVLQRGDQVRVYYRTSEDAHAAIFRIDTDGAISMVFPQHPGAIEPVRGGRDYRLLFPGSPAWGVGDDPGAGYFFMIASPEPLDFSAFSYDPRLGWDLGAVGVVVYEDPYVAIDDYVAAVVRDWQGVPYGLDFLTYHVGSTYSYPRFLCYDCHTRQSYTAWNPYSATCPSFRVVIWDDPYFYPAYRYSGTRVVVARPARALPRYSVVTRAAGDIGVRPLVMTREAPRRSVAQFKEAPTIAPSSRVPVRRIPPSVSALQEPQARGSARGGQQDPSSAVGRPTLQRRPSAGLPARTPPASPEGRAAGRALGASAPTSGARPDARRPDSGATPSRPTERRAPTPSATRPAPVDARPAPATARPAPTSGSPGARPATPARARGGSASPPPSARPATPNRPRTGTPAQPPSRPTARTSPPSNSPAARPSSPPARRPSARPAPAPRDPAPRPTVRPRGAARGN
jgi:hypothetical protein